MNKKMLITVCFAFIIGIIITVISITSNMNKDEKTDKIVGTVMNYKDDILTIEDENSVIYNCSVKNIDFKIGSRVILRYSGILNEDYDIQDCQVIDYEIVSNETVKNGIPTSWQDNGIFKDFYPLAYNKLKTLSLDEKIGQLLLVRYPDSNQINAIKKYFFGGYVFFERDFKDKTEEEVKTMIKNVQNASKIPLLTAVDEEGGKVVRISSNPNLAKEKFKSPSELYAINGFNTIKDDTKEKSRILRNLGLNVNLAPVVDVSTDSKDYMYERTLKENTSLTSTYAKTVIEASKGTGVSYTLKHFPGYGNNADTHLGAATDNRTFEEIEGTDLPPFKEGIKVGAEAVLVSHNIVNSIDNKNPASLSPSVHDLLRDNLSFTGVIITDDIAMNALQSIADITIKAIKAGNDLLITTDYEESFNSLKKALNDNTITEDQLDRHVFRVLAWKYYKMLIIENEK